MLEVARRQREEDSDDLSDDVDDQGSVNSEGSNMPPEHYSNDQMYWDKEELEFMQLDEFTAKREYYKVTCT